MVPHVGFSGEVNDLPDHLRALLILRMRFARHQHLHRTFRVGQNTLDPGRVPQQQRGPLVGGKPARKPDG